ncbi:protein canopy-1 [Quercus suber]|uniref:Protein canopy-1 n=1 Tax=Quercus suber TaxID=58331 RepID=A0AAW0ILL1_QUESU
MGRSAAWLVLTIFAVISIAYCIDDKCAACNAVAEELEYGLSNEKPRNHLDMRHRLDSKGQRKGKVIDYRVSELRVVELLDGLCDKMQDYTLEQIDSTTQEWVRVDDWNNLTTISELRVVELLDGLCDKMQDYTLEQIDSTTHEWVRVDDWNNLTTNKQEARAYSKAISSYCGRLIEETEDDLAELIKKGSVKVGDVSKVLCQNLSKHCSQTSGSQQADDNDHELDGEL